MLKIPFPPTDKAAHFGAGYIAAHLATVAIGPWWAMLVAMALGIGKEWYDSKAGGDVSAWDAAATFLGGVAFVAIHFLTH